ncbi:MAG: hypothetical protein NT080_10335 [Spirochaetes bacterium]|nr:hypothetical protein [Spirochaetota bacterium]
MGDRAFALACVVWVLAVSGVASDDEPPGGNAWRGIGVTIGQLNDNLPCPYEAAVDGWSVGPDDQYSFMLAAHIDAFPWSFRIDDIAVTSRAYAWRFDILKLSCGREFRLGPVDARAAIGFAVTGNAGGRFFQNAWHENLLEYPTVDFPYVESAFAPNAGLGVDYMVPVFPVDWLELTAFAEADLYAGFGPNAIRAGLDLVFERSVFRVEAIAGAGAHFFLPDRLDRVLANGFFGAALVTLRPSPAFGFSFGGGLFPVGTVDDDPAFRRKSYPAIPQFYYLATVGAGKPSPRDFPAP